MDVNSNQLSPTDPNYRHVVTCQQCSSVLIFKNNEILTVVENETEILYTINCPTCTFEVTKIINKKVTERPVRDNVSNSVNPWVL